MSFTKINHYEKEYADMHHDTALNVTEGVEDQPIVNPYFTRRKKPKLSTDQYVEGILAGNITTLSQAITLIESNNPAHYAQAQEIIERCLPHAGKSVRIGITGVPGAGKSTFIEAVGNMVTSLRHKLAVLAIDPSSERSGGSILGDKTRMESISGNPDVFIRPSPSAGSLGGVARKTRETIVLCEAAGFDVIFIETVGVGQSETAVHSMVDMFMLLQISGAGDELQGIKRGIMEMADIMVITKADGENIHKAELAKTQFQGGAAALPSAGIGLAAQSLHLLGRSRNGTGRGMERRRRVPRPHRGQRLLPTQPQPPEQILDVRVDQRSAAQLVLPRSRGRIAHRRIRTARAGRQDLVVHRRQRAAGHLFQGPEIVLRPTHAARTADCGNFWEKYEQKRGCLHCGRHPLS